MRKESFEQWNRRAPFEPYRIICTDGTVYDVRHPEMAMPTRSEIAIGAPQAGGETGMTMFLSYFHVIRIEPLVSPTSAGPDGE
jgi:hypothetical protein